MNMFLFTWELGYFGKFYFKVLIKTMPSGQSQNEVTDLKEMYAALELRLPNGIWRKMLPV